MMSFLLSDFSLEIRPLTDDDLAAVLDVYPAVRGLPGVGPRARCLAGDGLG